MRHLKVKRYKQERSHCSIAAVASISNFYNKEIDYDIVRQIAYSLFHIKNKDDFPGLESGDIGILLNILGFNKVTIISSDIDCFNFKLVNKNRKTLSNMIRKMSRKRSNSYKDSCKSLSTFLSNNDYDNNFVLDYKFGDYIREYINQEKPLLVSFNWTLFFKFSSDEAEYHVVVIDGVDNKKVGIIDSHSEYYKYKRKQYRNGKYTISWENLMSVIDQGDVIIPDLYTGLNNYELV